MPVGNIRQSKLLYADGGFKSKPQKNNSIILGAEQLAVVGFNALRR